MILQSKYGTGNFALANTKNFSLKKFFFQKKKFFFFSVKNDSRRKLRRKKYFSHKGGPRHIFGARGYNYLEKAERQNFFSEKEVLCQGLQNGTEEISILGVYSKLDLYRYRNPGDVRV
jgi:hypothetical protein